MGRKAKPDVYSEKALRRILAGLASHRIGEERAYQKLKHLAYEMLGYARVDHHRHLRKGFPEVVYAPGKDYGHLVKILKSLARASGPVLVTHLEAAVYRKLRRTFPKLRYSELARMGYWGKQAAARDAATVAVVTAGTSDVPVAEEGALTLELLGRKVARMYDCGVAGLHRILDQLPEREKAKAIVCVAGMEGALPSVLAGLVSKPIIAVPTSVGYGTHLGGLAPLLSMLNACAQGVAVVNIDNGFGAACFASLIA